MPAFHAHRGSWPPRFRAARRRAVAIAAAAATVLALGGCTSPAGTVAERTAPAAQATTPSAAPTAGVATDCGDELTALDAVITSQLAAFADDDWELALSLTSRDFRAGGIDADGLRQIVTSGYAVAADAADHEVLGCVRGGDDAQVLVDITATDGGSLELVYLLTREDGGWRISGAIEHDTDPGAPTTIPA